MRAETARTGRSRSLKSSDLSSTSNRATPSRTLVLFIGGALLCAALWVARWYILQRPVDEAVAQGKELSSRGDVLAAEDLYRKALSLDPSRPSTYYLLGDLYLRTDPNKAVELYRQMRTVIPGGPHELCRLAEAYAAAGQTGGARLTARDAVKAEPNCPRAHEQLGLALDRADQHGKALEELQTAQRLAPDDLHIAMELSQAQLSAAQLGDAAATAGKVLRSDPNNPMACYVVGWAHSRMGPTAENQAIASTYLQKALDLDPSRLDAASELGRLRARRGDFAGARKMLELAWMSGQRDAATAYNLSAVDRRLGDTAAAQTLLAAFQRVSDIDRQRKAMQMQLALTPHDISIAVRLADLEAQVGHASKAQAILMAVLREHPGNASALAVARKNRLTVSG